MFGTFLTKIPQNLDFPHFQLFQIFAHFWCSVMRVKKNLTRNVAAIDIDLICQPKGPNWPTVPPCLNGQSGPFSGRQKFIF